jgi:tRNA (guanine37-N1)-methyltransferase
MVMKIEPISNLIENLSSKRKYDEIIYLTPEGKLLDQKKSNLLSTLNNIIILCGHYKGIDQRIRDLYITKEISIGDYVLSGGELAAAILCDSIIRLIPGVLNDETSALNDSLQDNLLQPPLYTRPREFKGMKVPDILLSGHQQNIQIWRDKMSLEKTNKLRPDLIKKFK